MSEPVTLQCPQKKWIRFLLETEGDVDHGIWTGYPDQFYYKEQEKYIKFYMEIHWVDSQNNLKAVGYRKIGKHSLDRERHFTLCTTTHSTVEIRLENNFFAYKKLGEKKR